MTPLKRQIFGHLHVSQQRDDDGHRWIASTAGAWCARCGAVKVKEQEKCPGSKVHRANKGGEK